MDEWASEWIRSFPHTPPTHQKQCECFARPPDRKKDPDPTQMNRICSPTQKPDQIRPNRNPIQPTHDCLLTKRGTPIISKRRCFVFPLSGGFCLAFYACVAHARAQCLLAGLLSHACSLFLVDHPAPKRQAKTVRK